MLWCPRCKLKLLNEKPSNDGQAFQRQFVFYYLLQHKDEGSPRCVLDHTFHVAYASPLEYALKHLGLQSKQVQDVPRYSLEFFSGIPMNFKKCENYSFIPSFPC